MDEFGDMTTWPEDGGRRARGRGRKVCQNRQEKKIGSLTQVGTVRSTSISRCVFSPTASLSPSANSKHQCGLARRIFFHRDLLLYLLRRRTNKDEPPEQAEA